MLKPYARTRYRQKHAGLRTLRKAELRLKKLLRAASTSNQPSTRQTREVALLAKFRSHSVMARSAMFTPMTRFVERSFRSDQRVTISQKKNSPLTKHMTPSMFLLVAAPTYSGAPVQKA